jgi:hypothetical protein
LVEGFVDAFLAGQLTVGGPFTEAGHPDPGALLSMGEQFPVRGDRVVDDAFPRSVRILGVPGYGVADDAGGDGAGQVGEFTGRDQRAEDGGGVAAAGVGG